MELAFHLAEALRRFGDDPATAERLANATTRLAAEIASWAGRVNLTGPRTPELIAKDLLVPPLIWAKQLPAVPDSIVDIGSGAGIPGLPLSLRFPEADITLVEAREKRHHFQRRAIRILREEEENSSSPRGKGSVQAVLGRSDELSARAASLGVAQALAPLPHAVFHVKRWVRPGGIIAIPQNVFLGPLEDDDLRWVGCAEYPEAFQERNRFLWMSEKIR